MTDRLAVAMLPADEVLNYLAVRLSVPSTCGCSLSARSWASSLNRAVEGRWPETGASPSWNRIPATDRLCG